MTVTDTTSSPVETKDDNWIVSVALREFAGSNLDAIVDQDDPASFAELRRQAHRALALAGEFEARAVAGS